jgi:SAM-dependent methyltransferase
VQARRPDGHGRRALVVGAGFGDDAELVAGLGFETVAFDVSPSAIAAARRRHPGSDVRYVVADLLDPPAEWRAAFDLVVESLTAQSLPDPPRPRAIANVAAMVAPGGTLVVIAAAREPGEAANGPPWPLTRAEIDAFAAGGLEPVRVEDFRDVGIRWWRAELRRR